MCRAFLFKDLKGRNHLEYIAVDRRIILKLILRKCVRMRTGSEYMPVAVACEHGNETSAFRKGENFLNFLTHY
jgi:hypothetical protein